MDQQSEIKSLKRKLDNQIIHKIFLMLIILGLIVLDRFRTAAAYRNGKFDAYRNVIEMIEKKTKEYRENKSLPDSATFIKS